jgi:DNA repair photolyase
MEPQRSLFSEAPPDQPLARLGEQKDIRYYASAPRSILNSPTATGMGFWSINPFVGCVFSCYYCYARYAHRYTAERLSRAGTGDAGFGVEVVNMPPWLAFERRILVKREAGAILRRELRRPSRYAALQRETVVVGTATDPYQPAERRFRVTRGVLEAIAEQRGLSVRIITKSPLVTRDIDLLRIIAARSDLCVHVSLITVDRELARRIEPRAPTPEARLRGIARLRENGIEVGVNCMPVLPGITDAPEQIKALVGAIAAARASYINACALRLRSTARQQYMPFIEAEFPELAAKYRSTYAHGHQAGERYRAGLRERFSKVCDQHGVLFDRWNRVDDDDAETSESESVATQLAMAL